MTTIHRVARLVGIAGAASELRHSFKSEIAMRSTWKIAILVGVILGCTHETALASPIIDQSYLVATDQFHGGDPVTIWNGQAWSAAQTVVVGLSGLLTEVDLQVGGYASYPVTLEIGQGNNPNTDSLLASFNLTAPAWSKTGVYAITPIDVSAANIFVSTGENLVLSLFSASTTFGGWAQGGDSDGSYGGGQAYSAASGSPTFNPQANVDLAFRTWVNADVTPVPEPGALLTLGAGLLGLMLRRGKSNCY